MSTFTDPKWNMGELGGGFFSLPLGRRAARLFMYDAINTIVIFLHNSAKCY